MLFIKHSIKVIYEIVAEDCMPNNLPPEALDKWAEVEDPHDLSRNFKNAGVPESCTIA